MSIHSMLSIKNGHLLSFVPDYRIHLITPAQMEDEDFLKFRTGFGQVLQYIKCSKDKDKLFRVTHEGDRFRALDEESANLINTVTGSELKLETKEGKVDMCIAIDEMRKESADNARVKDIRELMENLKLTAIQAMNALGIPDYEQPRYLAML